MRRKAQALILLTWWWLAISGAGYSYRFGPYLERSHCSEQAAQYRAAGWLAWCVEERH